MLMKQLEKQIYNEIKLNQIYNFFIVEYKKIQH